MKLIYDSQTDSLYIDLADRPSAESREISRGVVADFDDHGRLVGLDIESASKVLDLSTVETLALPGRLRVA